MSFSSALVKLCSLLICSPFPGSKLQQAPSIIRPDRGTILSLENWIVGFMCCRPSRSKWGITLMNSRNLLATCHDSCSQLLFLPLSAISHSCLTWSCRDSLWPVPRCHRSRRSTGPPVRRGGPPALWPGSTCRGLGKEPQQCRPPPESPLSAPEHTRGHTPHNSKLNVTFKFFLHYRW